MRLETEETTAVVSPSVRAPVTTVPRDSLAHFMNTDSDWPALTYNEDRSSPAVLSLGKKIPRTTRSLSE